MSERSGNSQSDSLCNLEFLLVNLGRNQATAERLIKLFLDNHLILIRRMHEALGTGDVSALKDALHDIRSSCVLFSGHQCVDLAKSFESALMASGEPFAESRSNWSAMADALSQCMQRMAGELTSYLEKNS